MDTSTLTARLQDLAAALAGRLAPEPLLVATLPLLAAATEAEAAIALAHENAGPRLVARSGLDLAAVSAPPYDEVRTETSTVFAPVPQPWAARGVTDVAVHSLPGGSGTLVLAWAGRVPDEAVVDFALTSLDNGVALARAEETLADLVARVDNAQHLANMGDYDWHIATDVNTWSDQLFRIYGLEPQSLDPNYETFLSMIHEQDRDRIQALHQHAYATGEPYRMIERIVRPDGEVRYLSSNGEVILDESSTPVRMRGTCIDVTDHVRADQERQRSAARFQGLVDSAPDAILVLTGDQRILEANQRAHALLGGDARGHLVTEILPGWPHGTGTAVPACGLAGQDLLLDVMTEVLDADEEDPTDHGLEAVFLRDASVRLEDEALAARVAEARLRRRQALEINDNVVQGLVTAMYALELGDTAAPAAFLDRTLSAARAMMDDLLDPLDGQPLQPGDLGSARSTP